MHNYGKLAIAIILNVFNLGQNVLQDMRLLHRFRWQLYALLYRQSLRTALYVLSAAAQKIGCL